MNKYHRVSNVQVVDGFLCFEVDGEEVRQTLESLSALLGRATAEEISTFEVSPSGYGIHWPLLDEDISIDGMLGIVHRLSEVKKTA